MTGLLSSTELVRLARDHRSVDGLCPTCLEALDDTALVHVISPCPVERLLAHIAAQRVTEQSGGGYVSYTHMPTVNVGPADVTAQELVDRLRERMHEAEAAWSPYASGEARMDSEGHLSYTASRPDGDAETLTLEKWLEMTKQWRNQGL